MLNQQLAAEACTPVLLHVRNTIAVLAYLALSTHSTCTRSQWLVPQCRKHIRASLAQHGSGQCCQVYVLICVVCHHTYHAVACLMETSYCPKHGTKRRPNAAKHDISLQATAFREISIMQRVKHIPGVCQLHDYGITHDSITLVMARCRCSLREWRQRQPSQPHHQLRLYLNIFCRLAEIVQVWQSFVPATVPSQTLLTSI